VVSKLYIMAPSQLSKDLIGPILKFACAYVDVCVCKNLLYSSLFLKSTHFMFYKLIIFVEIL